jgi:hypothetical protein
LFRRTKQWRAGELVTSAPANAAAVRGKAVLESEPFEDAGSVFRPRKSHDGTGVLAVYDRGSDDPGVERVGAPKDDALAVEVRVLKVGSWRDEDFVPIGCSVNGFLNGWERGFPR